MSFIKALGKNRQQEDRDFKGWNKFQLSRKKRFVLKHPAEVNLRTSQTLFCAASLLQTESNYNFSVVSLPLSNMKGFFKPRHSKCFLRCCVTSESYLGLWKAAEVRPSRLLVLLPRCPRLPSRFLTPASAALAAPSAPAQPRPIRSPSPASPEPGPQSPSSHWWWPGSLWCWSVSVSGMSRREDKVNTVRRWFS